MSNEDANLLAPILHGIKSAITIFGTTIVLGFVSAAFFILNDHYTLNRVEEDADWMKPRVQSMWYKGHADMQETVDATVSHSVAPPSK